MEKLGGGDYPEKPVFLPTLDVDLPGTEGSGTVQKHPGLGIRAPGGKVTIQGLAKLEPFAEHLPPHGSEFDHDAAHGRELVPGKSQLPGHALLVVPLDARHHLLPRLPRSLQGITSHFLLRGRLVGPRERNERDRKSRQREERKREQGAGGCGPETVASAPGQGVHGSIPAARRASVSSETLSR